MPPFGQNYYPHRIQHINNSLAGLCRSTVMNLNEHVRKRLLTLTRHDAGKDRMIYCVYVTLRIEDDGSYDVQVHDFVHPEFQRIDREVAVRAAGARREVENILDLKDDNDNREAINDRVWDIWR